MRYPITWANSAVKALRRLDGADAKRIVRSIDALAHNPRPHDSRQLQGGSGERRIRIGDYRVIYDVLDAEVLILVLRIGHRSKVYRSH